MWLPVLGFMAVGLVSTLFLANLLTQESFLVVHALLSQDGYQQEGFWDVVRHMVSPFDLSGTLQVSAAFLSRPSCCKITHANGYYGAWPGWAVSIRVLPLTKLSCCMKKVTITRSCTGSFSCNTITVVSFSCFVK